MAKDRVDAPFSIQLRAYWGYAVLIFRGFLIDVFNLVKAVFFGLGNNLTKKPDERFVPLLDGWVCFFTRHLYGRIEDCWNRPIASSPENWFDVCERARNEDGELVLTGKTRHCLNLGSYNYLGFGGLDPYCSPRVQDSIRKYGVGVCLSPAEHGTPVEVANLERKVADFLNKEDAMIVGMGFATNSWTIPALAEPGCLIISDALNHFSIVEGVRGAGAKVKVFKHNDPADLESILKNSIKAGRGKAGDSYVPWKKILIIVEGIYSMEGEMCRMQEIIDVKKKYKAYLYLDEAHSIGAVGKGGRGVTEYFNVDRDEVDIMMGTFTKSFGSIGGYIAGKKEIVSALRANAANYVYSMAMSPACASQVIAAFELILGEDGTDRGRKKIAALVRNSKKFRHGLVERGFRVLGDPDSPVIPLMLYHPEWIAEFSRACFERKVAAVVVGYPATPLMYGRARFCVSAAHTDDEIELALKTIDEIAPHVKFDINNPNRIAEMEDQHTPYEVTSDVIPEVAEWEPEPLAVMPSTVHNSVSVASDDDSIAQFSRYDFLGLAKHPTVIDACVKTVDKYGCGSCGPRGFYGTVDVHLKLEEDISKFMGVEACILYSFGLNTVSSVIPAFAKTSDLIICDDGVNFAVESGVNLARCSVKYFRHNDMTDLRRVLREVESEDGLTSSNLRDPRRRRFLVIEGLYQKTGTLAPLKDILHLKKKYCLRLIMDESMSFGVLGATGRGATEHWGMPVEDVDIICASLECATASVGGFACGNKEVASHQRLSGSGYTFSASLPPFVSVGTSEALKIIDKEPSRIARLHENAGLMYEKLHLVPGIDVSGDPSSPLMHIRLSRSTGSQEADEARLLEICNLVKEEAGMEFHLSRYVVREKVTPAPSIRVCLSSRHNRTDIETAVDAIDAACHKVFLKDNTIPEEVTDPEPASLLRANSNVEIIKSFTVNNAPLGSAKMAKQVDQADADDVDDMPEVWVPIFAILANLFRVFRRYLADQSRWGTMVVLPLLEKFRNPMFDQFFKLASACGSEPFYTVMIPTLVWNFPETWYMRSLVFLFGLNVYLGSFLKNLMCLRRPETIYAGSAAQEHLDSRDYAWPSIYCINACSLPFFVLRSMHGNSWLWNQDHPAVTFFNYTLGFAWAGSICLSRLYHGVESPSDVQGGMLVGAIVLRVWFTVSDYLDHWVLSGCEGYIYVSFFSIFLLLLHPMPRHITSQASVTFKQACRNVSFMQGFFFGSCLRERHGWEITSPDSLYLMTVRNIIGFTILGLTYTLVSRGFRRLMEVVLKKLSTTKEDTDSVAMAKELIRTQYYSRAVVRHAGTFVTFASIGLAVSYVAPIALSFLA